MVNCVQNKHFKQQGQKQETKCDMITQQQGREGDGRVIQLMTHNVPPLFLSRSKLVLILLVWTDKWRSSSSISNKFCWASAVASLVPNSGVWKKEEREREKRDSDKWPQREDRGPLLINVCTAARVTTNTPHLDLLADTTIIVIQLDKLTMYVVHLKTTRVA